MSGALVVTEPTQLALGLPDPAAEGVTPFRLKPGDRIERSGVIYEFLSKETGGKRFVRLDTGAEVFVLNQLLVLEMSRRLIRLAPPEWMNKARSELWHLDFESRSETEKRLARMRWAYVEAFDQNRRAGYPLKVGEVVRAVYRDRMADPRNVDADETEPSLSIVYDWLKLWDDCKGPRKLKMFCFAESRRGPRGARLSAPVAVIVRNSLRELWFTPERKRVRHVWERVVAEGTRQGLDSAVLPCQRTIRRLIKALPPYAATRARFGKRAADQKYRSVGQMPEAAFPGEIYEVDAHKLDWMAVDEAGWPIGRLWVTVVIDRRTRCIVGFHLHVEPPCSMTIAAALRNAFAPKLYMLEKWPGIGRNWICWGLPVMLVLDNALENKARFLMEGLAELGVVVFFVDPRSPEKKPYVERFHGTMTGDLAVRVPGATGANVAERGDYDAEKMACLTLEQADELFHRWVSCYLLTWHEGLRGVPEQAWRDEGADLEVAPMEDIGMLDVLLGDYAERTVTREGIFVFGLRYGDSQDYRPLEHIRTRAGAEGLGKVRVRIDRNDLSSVLVQDPVTKEYIPVPSLDPDYTVKKGKMTLRRHRAIRQYAVERARGYVSVAALCLARDEIQRRIDEMTGREPMTERRAAAVYRGLGSKGSWDAFYRLDDRARKGGAADERPIIDLFETEDGWEMGPFGTPPSPDQEVKRPAKETTRNAAEAPAAVRPEPAPAAAEETDVPPREDAAEEEDPFATRIARPRKTEKG